MILAASHSACVGENKLIAVQRDKMKISSLACVFTHFGCLPQLWSSQKAISMLETGLSTLQWQFDQQLNLYSRACQYTHLPL